MNVHITEPLPTDKKARLAFGLEWRAYPPKGVKAERRRYAEDLGASHFVEFKVGDEVIGGFCAPDTAELKGSRLYSGAARVALHERIKSRQGALVLLQHGNEVNFVYVVRGAIRSDEVLSLEDARTRTSEVEQQCLKNGIELRKFGSGDSIPDVDEPFKPAELLGQKKLGRIAKIPLAIPVLIPLTFIVVVGFVVGRQLIDVIWPAPPPAAPPTWLERYAAAARQVFVAQPPKASDLAPKMIDEIGRMETHVAGWQFESTECSTRGNCTVTYRRAGGSFESFSKAATAGMQPVLFQPDGLRLSARGVAIPKAQPVTLSAAKDWPSAEALIRLLQTPPQRLSKRAFELDSYGYKVSLDPPKPLISPEGPDGRKPGLVLQGEWRIEGYRWQSALLAKLPANLTLESVRVTLEASGSVGIKFEAKGKYYVLQ